MKPGLEDDETNSDSEMILRIDTLLDLGKSKVNQIVDMEESE